MSQRRRMFEYMDGPSRLFYARVFNTAMLNLHAVRRGFFDTLICESDDPNVLARWKAAVPEVVELIKQQSQGE